MDIIGAGLSRTGTMSTQAALQILGYPCYHMSEVARSDQHIQAWQCFMSGVSTMNWAELLTKFKATVDTPCCLYYQEMMAAFPDAKVLLTLRDPDKWYDSLVSLSSALEEFRSDSSEHPRLAGFLEVADLVGMKLTRGDFSRENCIDAFHQHNADVQANVPAERLLVFQVEEGWQPLCEFLDKEIPAVAFPHLNEGKETIQSVVSDNLLD